MASSLSEDLLFALFDNISSVAHLAQCRLVCKHWNEPAAKTMFSKKITVKSEKQALKLYRHLFRDPSKTPIIKHLHFELDSIDLPLVIEELLHVVFTPNIERLTGYVKTDKFFTTLFEIADGYSSSFDQLKSLTKYTGQNEHIGVQWYLKFKSAIHTFTLEVVSESSPESKSLECSISWTENLKYFTNLHTLTLKGIFYGLEDIEERLKECHHLKTVNFQEIDYDGWDMDMMTNKEVASWVTSNVKKQESLQTINFEALCRADLFEYLLFKYPNVTNITIKGQLWFPSKSLYLDHQNLRRILDALKRIPQKKIIFILPANVSMKSVIELVISRDEDIQFNVEEIESQSQLVMKIN
ncbi:hypothetical protein HMPREF1544_02914 [Mucor circinelloides 1006PhL]|uniref:F-box domain-containing protein n=1 Tax=Mucor circinelloides f. circinelloides (strain 1006PhL) TaxID=1220926 RepID=S2JJW0_MUCC1|nr:hypothetical protein HMPREF1544_02914 [Mucor circinelloides 1006PhL]KAG1107296.1 hypothetical protein G6F42_016418 [Rhizopus arrhizus]